MKIVSLVLPLEVLLCLVVIFVDSSWISLFYFSILILGKVKSQNKQSILSLTYPVAYLLLQTCNHKNRPVPIKLCTKGILQIDSLQNKTKNY